MAGLLLTACTTHAPAPPAPAAHEISQPFSHAAFDAFLARHVDGEGRVDYSAASRDREDLDRYLAALAVVSPDSHPERFSSEAERLAYWINAYNASAIALVLTRYPVAGVKDFRPPAALFFLPRLSGFFVFQRAVLGERAISLLALENRLIRRRFRDPRIHFALNCASRGCPRLPARAFDPAGLEASLERETRRFLGEERNVRFDPPSRTLTLSAIFDWYEADFTRWLREERPEQPATLAAWVSLHASDPPFVGRCEDCRVEFAPYDWALNDRR